MNEKNRIYTPIYKYISIHIMVILYEQDEVENYC